MIKNNHQKTALLLFIGMILFACTTYIFSYTIPQLLLGKGLTLLERDHIEVLEMLGYVIAGLVLTSIINKIHFNKTVIICLVILIICTFNIVALESYEALKINFIIMSAAYYSYLIITIIKILETLNDHRYYAMVIFVMLWVSGHFIARILEGLFNSALNSLVLCVLFYFTIIMTCLYKDTTINKTISATPKFSFLISNIELQVLTGFIVTYITVDILWFYEDFALARKLALSNIETVLHYMLTSVFLATIPVILILKKVNKYLANLFFIIVLLASFILVSKYGTNFTANICFLSLIGVCLSSICICNILILCDKFESHDLRSAITIYFTMCAIGMIAGSLSSNPVYHSVNEDNFLFSATVVVGTFILYYFWYFIRRKLYRL